MADEQHKELVKVQKSLMPKGVDHVRDPAVAQRIAECKNL